MNSTNAFSIDEFHAVMKEVLQPFPSDLKKQLHERFEHCYNHPLVEELEIVLRKRIVPYEAQCIQFRPTPEQYHYYVSLIQNPPENAPISHPQAKVQRQCLPMLYLHHLKKWDFAQEFILYNGLSILTEMFGHKDLHLRGQIIDSFMQITSNECYEWFEPAKSTIDRKLHQAMLKLIETKTFVSNLLLNGEPQQSYPGGSLCALEILAFYLSWVRKLYCKDNVLRVSGEILKALQNWGAGRSDLSPGEQELAKKVYDDFSRWPALDANPSDEPRDLQSVITPATRLKEMMTKAKNAIEAYDYDTAIQQCNRALELSECDTLEALKIRAKAKLERNLSPDDLEECIKDCDSVINRSSDVSKVYAYQYKVRALGVLEREDEVVKLSDEAIQDCENIDKQEMEILRQLVEAQCCIFQQKQRDNSEKNQRDESMQKQNILNALLERASGEPHGGNPSVKTKPPLEGQPDLAVDLSKFQRKDKIRTKSKSKQAISTSLKTSPITTACLRHRSHPAKLFKYLARQPLDEVKEALKTELNERILEGIFRLLSLDLVPSDRKHALSMVTAICSLDRFELAMTLLPKTQELVKILRSVQDEISDHPNEQFRHTITSYLST